MTGTVRWFCTRRAFGFIRAHDPHQDVFFHQLNLSDTSRLPQTGDCVEFRLINATPSNCALDVTLISPGANKNVQSPHRKTSSIHSSAPASDVRENIKAKTPVSPLGRGPTEPRKENVILETCKPSASIDVKVLPPKPRKNRRKTTKRRVTRRQLSAEESSPEDRPPPIDDRPTAREENLSAEEPPYSEDELLIQEENCFPLCSLGQVQRQEIGPFSSVYLNPTPSTSTSTDTSRLHHVEC